MAKCVWEVELNGNLHTICLEHRAWVGMRSIWIDERLVEQARKVLDWGSLHPFEIDGHKCRLGIITNGFVYGYFFQIDDELIEPAEGPPTRSLVRRWLQASRDEALYWEELEEATGLHRIAVPDGVDSWRHRLVGKILGQWVVVLLGFMDKTSQVAMVVIVRFGRSAEPKTTRAQIQRDPCVRQLIGKWASPKQMVKVQDSYSWLTLRYRPRKELPSRTAAQITDVGGLHADKSGRGVVAVLEGGDTAVEVVEAIAVVGEGEASQSLGLFSEHDCGVGVESQVDTDE